MTTALDHAEGLAALGDALANRETHSARTYPTDVVASATAALPRLVPYLGDEVGAPPKFVRARISAARWERTPLTQRASILVARALALTEEGYNIPRPPSAPASAPDPNEAAEEISTPTLPDPVRYFVQHPMTGNYLDARPGRGVTFGRGTGRRKATA